VFCHKGILIETKTLPDTVQPAEHWTLRAARRGGGCACCAEEEEIERMVAGWDDGDGGDDGGGGREERAGTTAPLRQPSKPASTGYVDGKTTFAFDPTKFS
jgi:hypothetical protein